MQELRDLNSPSSRRQRHLLRWRPENAAFDRHHPRSRTCEFSHSGNPLGTLADAASISWPKRIPYHIAMDMCSPAAGSTVVERTAGASSRDPAGRTLMDRAWRLARLLESGPRSSMPQSRKWSRMPRDGLPDDHEQGHPSPVQDSDVLYSSEDQLEGASRLCGKRDPSGKGR